MSAVFSLTQADIYQFNVCLSHLDVCTPLRLDPENVGVILDDDGRDFATVDVNGEREDGQADAIARLIVLALNRYGGFPAGTGDAG